MFFFRDLPYPQAAAKICISSQADSLHNVNIINSHHRLDLRYLSLYQISNFILVWILIFETKEGLRKYTELGTKSSPVTSSWEQNCQIQSADIWQPYLHLSSPDRHDTSSRVLLIWVLPEESPCLEIKAKVSTPTVRGARTTERKIGAKWPFSNEARERAAVFLVWCDTQGCAEIQGTQGTEERTWGGAKGRYPVNVLADSRLALGPTLCSEGYTMKTSQAIKCKSAFISILLA